MTQRRGLFAIVLVLLLLAGLYVSYESDWNPYVVAAFVVAWFGVRLLQRKLAA